MLLDLTAAIGTCRSTT